MNVKPGDLAICTHGRHTGKIGTVLRAWTPGQAIDGKLWADAPPELAPFWVIEAAGYFVHPNGKSDKRGPFPDSWLRPVSGIPEVEQNAQEVTP
jgi:hypothetical protein